jgi:4-carboxymuconolactone decarboxylase
MVTKRPLPDDLAQFRDTYAEMFGSVPPLPAAKFEFSGEVDPEALRLVEQIRAHAFYNVTFDEKTTQLLIFSMLLAKGSASAKHQAIAARRAGATWRELHAVIEMGAAVAALGAFNEGSALLHELRSRDTSDE